MSKIQVIGIGYKPLDNRAREIIAKSEIIIVSRRLCDVFEEYQEYDAVKNKVEVINGVDETIDFIRKNYEAHAITLLASGDPLFFGIGRKVVAEFGKDAVEISPELSSVQLAFSRIKEPWDDALLISLHGSHAQGKRRGPKYEVADIPNLLARHHKIAVLTDRESNPSLIAGALKSSAIDRSALRIHVCEKLGYKDERITAGTPEEIAGREFREPNVVILHNASQGVKEDRENIRFGLTESEIIHSRGLITKDEIRAVTIHKLRLPQGGVFWDIGAGSGSISVEVARLCPDVRVFAIEKDRQRVDNIRANCERFSTGNITIIHGAAPEELQVLPSPQRVFMGGSGGRLEELIDLIGEVMVSGIIVLNAVTLETLHDAIRCLEKDGFLVEVTEVVVSKSRMIAGKKHMSALNPVFIITGEKR